MKGRRPPLLAYVAIVVASLLLAARARAATVVLASPPDPSPTMTEALARVRAELTLAGFNIEVVEEPATDERDEPLRHRLERLGSGRDADAVLAFVGGERPDSVEVWVVDKVTAKSVVRQVALPSTGPAAPTTLAIRAIELLRASFLEIDLATSGRPADAKPTPAQVARFVAVGERAAAAERLGLHLGASVTKSVGSIPFAVMPTARVEWALRPSQFIVQLSAAGMGTRPTVTAATGRAEVAREFALVGAAYRLGSEHVAHSIVSLACGVQHTSVDGQAAPPYEGAHANLWSFLIDAAWTASIPLYRRYRLSAGAHIQLAEPYPNIRFAGAASVSGSRPDFVVTVTTGAWL